jgi:TetR/AcrR family transcriptional regulator, transcriptional repressor of bet genes
MSPRQYRGNRRKEAKADTQRRILEATIELHAKHGIGTTTYAMIAKRADVAVPTVYNHFPTLDELQTACGGHVMAQAPRLGPEIFDKIGDVEGRLSALVARLVAFYRFVSPWMRWSYYEARLIAEVGPRFKKAAEHRRELILLALAPSFGTSPPAALAALCECLVDYPAWERLTQERGLSDAEAATALGDALIALAREHGSAAGRVPVAESDKTTGHGRDSS